jgi:hypothetical protein
LKRLQSRDPHYAVFNASWRNTRWTPNLLACLIFKMLPHKPPYKPVMDRTSWKFGQTNMNVLTLAIVYDGIAFPILMEE